MDKEKDKLESLFKSRFENEELPIPQGMWDRVRPTLPPPPSQSTDKGSAGAAATPWIKLISTFVVATFLSGIVIYLVSKPKEKHTATNNKQTEQIEKSKGNSNSSDLSFSSGENSKNPNSVSSSNDPNENLDPGNQSYITSSNNSDYTSSSTDAGKLQNITADKTDDNNATNSSVIQNALTHSKNSSGDFTDRKNKNISGNSEASSDEVSRDISIYKNSTSASGKKKADALNTGTTNNNNSSGNTNIALGNDNKNPDEVANSKNPKDNSSTNNNNQTTQSDFNNPDKSTHSDKAENTVNSGQDNNTTGNNNDIVNNDNTVAKKESGTANQGDTENRSQNNQNSNAGNTDLSTNNSTSDKNNSETNADNSSLTSGKTVAENSNVKKNAGTEKSNSDNAVKNTLPDNTDNTANPVSGNKNSETNDSTSSKQNDVTNAASTNNIIDSISSVNNVDSTAVVDSINAANQPDSSSLKKEKTKQWRGNWILELSGGPSLFQKDNLTHTNASGLNFTSGNSAPGLSFQFDAFRKMKNNFMVGVGIAYQRNTYKYSASQNRNENYQYDSDSSYLNIIPIYDSLGQTIIDYDSVQVDTTIRKTGVRNLESTVKHNVVSERWQVPVHISYQWRSGRVGMYTSLDLLFTYYRFSGSSDQSGSDASPVETPQIPSNKMTIGIGGTYGLRYFFNQHLFISGRASYQSNFNAAMPKSSLSIHGGIGYEF